MDACSDQKTLGLFWYCNNIRGDFERYMLVEYNNAIKTVINSKNIYHLDKFTISKLSIIKDEV